MKTPATVAEVLFTIRTFSFVFSISLFGIPFGMYLASFCESFGSVKAVWILDSLQPISWAIFFFIGAILALSQSKTQTLCVLSTISILINAYFVCSILWFVPPGVAKFLVLMHYLFSGLYLFFASAVFAAIVFFYRWWRSKRVRES
jgi:hypothetical protein